jgi:hypothetical protein
MNTKTDETLLARWLEDDLDGAELAAFEREIAGNAGLSAERERVRAMRRDIAAVLPAAEEPPYPDFFNSRIERAIREQSGHAVAPVIRRPAWRVFWMPATAVAGMALAFWLGTQAVPRQEIVVAPQPAPPVEVAAAPEPGLYTPERGVDAEWFASEEAEATVIVLEGVDAIPDSLDFSETVSVSGDSQGMAGVKPDNEKEVRQ